MHKGEFVCQLGIILGSQFNLLLSNGKQIGPIIDLASKLPFRFVSDTYYVSVNLVSCIVDRKVIINTVYKHQSANHKHTLKSRQ